MSRVRIPLATPPTQLDTPYGVGLAAALDLHPELRRDLHRELKQREASRHPAAPRAYPSTRDYENAGQDEAQRARQTMYRHFNASKQFEAGVLREAAGAQEQRLRATRATIAELEGGGR